MDFFCFLLPGNVELWFLLLKLCQLRQHYCGICLLRQLYPVGKHRFENRHGSCLLKADALAGNRPGRPCHRTDRPCFCLLNGFKLLTGIDSDLVDLFLSYQFPDLQAPAGNLHIGQPVPLVISCDFKHLRTKFRRIIRHGHIVLHPLHKGFDPVKLQRRSEKAGEYLPCQNHLCHIVPVNHSVLKELIQGRLAAHGQILIKTFRPLFPEIHNISVQFPSQFFLYGLFPLSCQIHLIDKQEGGNLISGKKPPQCLRMSLHAVRAADYKNRIIQHLQCTLHLSRKIHMAGSI